jgi:hypothetical protein
MPMISTAPVVRMAKPPEEKISRLSDQLLIQQPNKGTPDTAGAK